MLIRKEVYEIKNIRLLIGITVCVLFFVFNTPFIVFAEMIQSMSDVIPPDPNYEKQVATGKELKQTHYSIYSPLSLIEAVSTGIIQNYWNKTENYEALAEYIRMNYDGLKDSVALLMDGCRIEVNISKYQNDMTSCSGANDVLVMLIHLGYLGYDVDTREVFIPNKEILDEFKNSTESKEWVDTFVSIKKSQELLNATWECNEGSRCNAGT